MELGMYWTALLAIGPLSLLLAGREPVFATLRRFTPFQRVRDKYNAHSDVDDEAKRFRCVFLRVYLLVMGSEWLQGPYMYTLLHDEKSFSEGTVASLYAVTYASAAVSALATGFLADRFGRRNACLAFCLLHSLSSLTVLSSSLTIICAGRVLAGIALTLLWTVFESWMVTEFNGRGLNSSSVSLSSMLGVMTTSNCAAAILGGVVAHCLVLALGSRTHPVLAGVVLEAAAAFLMMRDWNENYGEATASVPEKQEGIATLGGSGQLKDVRIWGLSFISCIFEGTNFLVLFHWPRMLQEAHRRADPTAKSDVPYGVAFATFMATMIIGAVLFDVMARRDDRRTVAFRRLETTSILLAGAVVVAGFAISLLLVATSELSRFGAFLLFEACNGVYLPSMDYQRGLVVDGSNRTGLYGLMKIPLFVFVVWSLGIMPADDGKESLLALFVCAILLYTAAAFSLTVGILGHIKVGRKWAQVVGGLEGAELDGEVACPLVCSLERGGGELESKEGPGP